MGRSTLGQNDGNLYALKPNGSLKWKYPTGQKIFASSPALGADGTVYVGSDDGNLYALNPDGSLKWQYKTGGAVDSSPALGADGTVYFGSDDANLYALNPDGSLKWRYPTGDFIISSPAIGVDGTLYVESGDGNLYAISQGPLQPVLTLTKSVNFLHAIPGETVCYTLNYSNTGAIANNVMITDTLPAGFSYVSGSASGAVSYDAASRTLTWKLGSLIPVDTGELTYLALVSKDAVPGSTISNHAVITSVRWQQL